MLLDNEFCMQEFHILIMDKTRQWSLHHNSTALQVFAEYQEQEERIKVIFEMPIY